jgi:D-beta-D-heptose 7-phosphate kinase / D-beta-D-heptose 1-phosphate adenosyltransferase
MRKFSLQQARLQLQKIRKGKRVVMAAGTFDLLHPGHLDYFEWAKRHGDVLVVCVVGDKRTRRRKKTGRPIVKEEWRALMVSSLKPVDVVFVSDRRPFEEEIIRALRPNVVVTPGDEPSKESKDKFAIYFRQEFPEIKLVMKNRTAFNRRSSTRAIIAKVKRLP